MNGENERRSINGVALSWGKLAITLVVYVLTIGVIYGTMRSQLDEVRQEVRDLKQQAISDPQFKEFKEDMQRRLQRIEDKLDREKAIEQLH